jgi:hypothetical protein
MAKEIESRTVSHIVSLVLGIISIISALFWYISIPSGIIAIVFGTKSYKRFGKKMGVGGLVTGIVGLSLCVLFYISVLLIVILENRIY